MQKKIETLAVLFKQRSEIDSKIEQLIEGESIEEDKQSGLLLPCLGLDRAKEGADETVTMIHRKKRAACPECGSIGSRHKLGCKNAYHGFPVKDHPRKEIHGYQCRNCSTQFKSNLPKIDVFCPECRSVDVDDYEEKVIITTSKK